MGERTDEAHEADCEHHALILTADGYIEAVCLQPDSHDASADDATAAAAAEAKRAQREFAEAMEVANAVRGEWLRTWIRSYKLSAAQVVAVMTAAARSWMHDRSYYTQSADVAGWLQVDLDPKAGVDVAKDALDGWLATSSVTPTSQRSPAKFLVAVMAAKYEVPDSWDWQDRIDALRPWFDLLAQLGYQLSEWERKQLDAAAADEGGDGG